jgi:hypothetical protein
MTKKDFRINQNHPKHAPNLFHGTRIWGSGCYYVRLFQKLIHKSHLALLKVIQFLANPPKIFCRNWTRANSFLHGNYDGIKLDVTTFSYHSKLTHLCTKLV